MKKEFFVFLMVFVGLLLGSAVGGNQHMKYKPGVYYGTSLGFMDSITVEVEIKNDAIKKVRVVKHQEDRELGSIRQIPFLIKKNQGTQSVEAVTGATTTSDAIKEAVDLALKKASVSVDSSAKSL